MSNRLTTTLNFAANTIILALLVSLPLFFLNLTTDFFETPKLLLLIIGTAILLVLASVSSILEGKFSLTRSPFDLPLVMLGVVLILSTFFSDAKWVSILGNFPRVHGGLVTYLIYILFYFALIAHIKKISQARTVIIGLISVGVILAVQSLLSFFGVYLPLPFAKSINFTLTGSNFSTTSLMALMLPFPVLELLNLEAKKIFKFNVNALKPIWAAVAVLFGLTIILTGSWAVMVAAVVGVVLTLLAVPQTHLKKNYLFLAVPAGLLAVAALLTFANIPGLNKNPLYTKKATLVAEYQLPFVTSWKTSVSAFRDAPFWGTGPGTYLFDFTQYKPFEYNANKALWNIRFDTAFNEYLGVLATLGGTGLLAMLLLTAIFLSLALRHLIWTNHEEEAHNLAKFTSLSGIVFFTLLALHPSTLLLWVLGLTVLALFAIVHKKVSALQLSSSGAVTEFNQAMETIPGVILMVLVVGLAVGLFFTGKFAIADYHHRKGLNYVSTGAGIEAYNSFIRAEQLNPHVDVYRTDLAQTNFALANAIAISRAPSEASPSGSLTDQDRQNIQVFLSQSITEARKATELSPNNPINWEILGAIYRQIAGVADNALAFSLDSYGRAIQKDPLNPLLRLTAGGIYYSVQNFDLAIRFFSDSISLKPDYANAYYNLAVALKDKGDIRSAILSAEEVIKLVDANSEDYKVAEALLNDLKSKADSTATPPTANSPKIGNEENLEGVIDLPKPEQVTTPSAVKKPAASPSPSASPTAAP